MVMVERKPAEIKTAWGSFWAIGDRSARIFMSEEEAQQAIDSQKLALAAGVNAPNGSKQ
jgi:hypothetical protein